MAGAHPPNPLLLVHGFRDRTLARALDVHASPKGRDLLRAVDEAVVYDVGGEAIRLATAITYGSLERLREMIGDIRSPHGTFWFEYDGAERRRWYAENGVKSDPEGPTMPRRVGVLVRSDGDAHRVTHVFSLRDGTIEGCGFDAIVHRRKDERHARHAVPDDRMEDAIALVQKHDGMTRGEAIAQIAVSGHVLFEPNAFMARGDRFARKMRGRVTEADLEEMMGGLKVDAKVEATIALGVMLLLTVPGFLEPRHVATPAGPATRTSSGRHKAGTSARSWIAVEVSGSYKRDACEISSEREALARRAHRVRGHFRRLPTRWSFVREHTRYGVPGDTPDRVLAPSGAVRGPGPEDFGGGDAR